MDSQHPTGDTQHDVNEKFKEFETFFQEHKSDKVGVKEHYTTKLYTDSGRPVLTEPLYIIRK